MSQSLVGNDPENAATRYRERNMYHYQAYKVTGPTIEYELIEYLTKEKGFRQEGDGEHVDRVIVDNDTKVGRNCLISLETVDGHRTREKYTIHLTHTVTLTKHLPYIQQTFSKHLAYT